MTKQDFLAQLRKGLNGLPQEAVEERISFYAEMIDDRREDGASEEEAVQAVGTAEEEAARIIAEYPLTKLVKKKIVPKRLKAREITLLVLGSPLWLPLLLAFFAVFLALYAVLWAVLIAFWAVFLALAAGALACVAAGILFFARGLIPSGLAVFSAGLVSAGLSVFLFFGCKAATKGFFVLTKRFVIRLKNRLLKKEDKQ